MEPVANEEAPVAEHGEHGVEETVQAHEEAPAAADVVVPSPEPVAAPVSPAPAEAVATQINEDGHAGREYPSLYDTKGTTVVAILLGISIVAAIQFGIVRMYTTAKTEQAYLTRFVTALVGLVMGAYIADLLIAGPSTNLLSDADHTLILSFIKDIALMIFAYYFGTKSAGSSSSEE